MAEDELLKTQSGLKRTMAELKVLQNREQKRGGVDPDQPAEPSAPMADVDVEKEIDNDPDVQKFLQREAQTRGFIANSKRAARNPGDPSIQTPSKELANIRKQRQALENRLRSDLRAGKGGTAEAATRPNRAWPRPRRSDRRDGRSGTRTSGRGRQVQG